VWGLRKIAPDKIRRYFDELAAMDLAKVQGTGSRLTLISKVITVDEMSVNPQQHHQNQNPDNARVLEKSNSEVSRTGDEVLIESQEAKTYIYQEVQEINHQSVDVVDAVQNFNTDTQPLNLEPDTDAVEVSVEEFEISEKTSTPSTLANNEFETLVQQEKIGVDESSTPPSTVEDSSTLSSTKTNAGKKHRTFEVGDRVVIAEVGTMHQGQHGEVVHVGYGSRKTDYIVKLDKESRGSKQVRVTVPKGSKLTFLMKL